jgi:hypothetical protein
MGAIAIAVGGLVLGAFSAHQAYESRQDAKEQASKAAEQQRLIQSEQKAQNNAQAAAERRRQVREERVRRSQIESVSTLTGGWGGSATSGATGGLATQLASNIGQNLGAIGSANRISGYQQQASIYDLGFQQATMDMQDWQSFGSFGMQAFNMAAPHTKFFNPKG